jgi:hypothetical protein
MGLAHAMRTKKPKITRRWLRSLQLDETERLKLSLFVANHRHWTLRHAVALEEVIRQFLRQEWLELRRLEKVEPHPVYEMVLRLGRSSPRTKTGVERAVRWAFGCGGRVVKRGNVLAHVSGDRAKVTVLVDGAG